MHQEIEKWHGCKNDFIVTMISDADGEVLLGSLRRQAPLLCARDGSGIGADGILVLQSKLRTDLLPDRLAIINSDGSFAANCGNGIRCAATAIRRRFLTQAKHDLFPDALELQVGGNTIVCRFLDRGTDPRQGFIAVDMGLTSIDRKNSWHQTATQMVERIAAATDNKDLGRDLHTCEIGNRHVAFFLESISRELLLKVGPALQKAEAWDGINVHLCVQESLSERDAVANKKLLGAPVSELYRVLVWERGAGETQACGSGACAVAASVLATGLADRQSWIAVDMPGGRLFCRQDSADAPVILAGPAQHVFDGTLDF